MIKTVIAATDYASVVKVQLNDQIDILEITHPNCTATISLYAGHVLQWQPTQEKPVLWLSKAAKFSLGTAIRGGIPICWPWFGEKLNAQLENVGNHGFARTSSWLLKDVNIQPEHIEIILVLTGKKMHPDWPHTFELKQQLILSSELRQTLEFTNNTGVDLELGHAFHTYFAVSSPKNTRITQLDQVPFDDKVTGKYLQQDSLKDCVGQIDRVYYDNNEQVIRDSGWQREIVVSTENSHHWVLWNPGKALADSMADVHENGEDEYVCLEAADAKTQVVQDGQTNRVAQLIQVRPMPL